MSVYPSIEQNCITTRSEEPQERRYICVTVPVSFRGRDEEAYLNAGEGHTQTEQQGQAEQHADPSDRETGSLRERMGRGERMLQVWNNLYASATKSH